MRPRAYFLLPVCLATTSHTLLTFCHLPTCVVSLYSLGGNCKTVMIATINPEEEQTGESISTCRFSQRVACVKNSAIVNEETDPMLIIRK